MGKFERFKSVPEEAEKIFSQETNNQPEDVVRAKVKTATGHPCSARTARRWHLHWRLGKGEAEAESGESEQQPQFETRNGEYVARSVTETIKNVPELLKACGVDEEVFMVSTTKQPRIKTYQVFRRKEYKNLSYTEGKATGELKDRGKLEIVTLYSVEVWLELRPAKPFEDTISELLLKKLRKSSSISLIKRYPPGDHLMVPSIYDPHWGRAGAEGSPNPPEQTSKEYEAVSIAMAERVLGMGYRPEKIMFPLGNDLTHVDNLKNTTTKGTWQEVSAEARHSAKLACASIFACVDRYLEVAPVDIIVIAGNHDEYACFLIGLVIDAYYHNNKHVTVENSTKPRKYYQYGKNLIGMEHGARVKAKELALLMAHEAAPMWADTKYRTFFRGHFHEAQELYQMSVPQTGVSIVTIPALCPPNQWELMEGYAGKERSAELRMFHKEYGPAGTFPVYVSEVVRE